MSTSAEKDATLDQARSTLAIVSLAGATLVGAVYGPPLGSPDPTVMMAILFASLTSSIAGFAFSAICGGILFHLWDDHVRVVQIMVACSIANQTAMVWSLRDKIEWRRLGITVSGGACGVPLGAWALLHADRRHFEQALGVLLLAYGAYLLLGKPRRLRLEHPWVEAAIGFLGGILGAAAALPSIPLMVWCGLKGCGKDAQRALCQPFILVMQVLALATIRLLAPPHVAGLDLADLLCIPAGLFGTQVGLGCYRGLSHRQFAAAVSVLLIFAGLSFVL